MKASILAYRGIEYSKSYYRTLQSYLTSVFGNCDFLKIDFVKFGIEDEETDVYYSGGGSLAEYDVIMPRVGPSFANYAYLVLDFLEEKVYFPNDPKAYLVSNNPFHTLQILREEGLRVPNTYLAVSRASAKKKCEEIGGEIVIKFVGRGMGRGVIFAENVGSAYSILDALEAPKGTPIVIQEFLPNPGEDIRLFVVGGKVVSSMKRVARKDELRSNIHAGGTGYPYNPSEDLERMAVRASRAIGADICGVDLLVSDGRPYVLETNMNPGFRISDVTGVDVMKEMVEFVTDEFRRIRPKLAQRNGILSSLKEKLS